MLKETNTPTRLRIEPGSPDPESDALTTRPVRPQERKKERKTKKTKNNNNNNGGTPTPHETRDIFTYLRALTLMRYLCFSVDVFRHRRSPLPGTMTRRSFCRPWGVSRDRCRICTHRRHTWWIRCDSAMIISPNQISCWMNWRPGSMRWLSRGNYMDAFHLNSQRVYLQELKPRYKARLEIKENS